MTEQSNDQEQVVTRTSTSEQTQPAVNQPVANPSGPVVVQSARNYQEPYRVEAARSALDQSTVRSTVSDTRHEPLWSATGVRITTFILGVIEVFLGLRLILKLFGASTSSWFVQFIYDVTHVLIIPFTGIFKTANVSEIDNSSVLEPATLVAMLVYALLAWGIVKLIMIFRRKSRV